MLMNLIEKVMNELTYDFDLGDATLNSDGSSLGNPSRSGFGGIFRNPGDEWLLGCVGYCGVTTNINLIKDNAGVHFPHAAILNSIRAFSSLNWNLQFQHTLREANSCADWLAKSGARSNQFICT
ncbi:hypothetical protein GmHk_06G016685 [Glycine max]|nr:hypothetical protein GmHk_06G016685 [Glycine max]